MKIGILGGGQLARMLALAAYPLGIEVICLDPSPHACANQVATVVQTAFENTATIATFLADVDCVTYETENIPLAFAELFSEKLYPSIQSLRYTQDRLYEKELFQSLDIPTPRFHRVDTLDDLMAARHSFSCPSLLKTRKNGYDGKGQALIRHWDNAKDAWESLPKQALILEEFISFNFEVSILTVRDRSGQIVFYPLVLNKHENGILRLSKAPFENQTLQALAQTYATRILEELNHVGMMAIEFFCKGDQLIANEIAPRVHNSGHWTIEGAQTSQFENHMRAIAGLPLGSTQAIGYTAMVNAIGHELPLDLALQIPDLHYHTYGKEARPLRKLGHATIRAENPTILENHIKLLQQLTT